MAVNDFSKFEILNGSNVDTYKIKDSSAVASVTVSGTNIVVTGRDGTSKTAALPPDTKVTLTVTNPTSNTSYRPIIAGKSSTDSNTPVFSNMTDTTYALAKMVTKPDTGDLHLYNTTGNSPKMYFNSGSMTSGGSIVYNATTKSLDFEF